MYDMYAHVNPSLTAQKCGSKGTIHKPRYYVPNNSLFVYIFTNTIWVNIVNKQRIVSDRIPGTRCTCILHARVKMIRRNIQCTDCIQQLKSKVLMTRKMHNCFVTVSFNSNSSIA